MSEQERSTGKGNKLVDLDGGDPKNPKKTTTGQVPKTSTSGGMPAAPAVVTKPGTPAPPAPPPPPQPREQTSFQKSQLTSGFQNAGDLQNKAKLAHSTGNTKPPLFDDDDEPTAIGVSYDGLTPAKELTSRDLWKAVQAPIQSREGRRSPDTYQMVINQFAVGHNPRYEPDAPDKPRGHIFVWDISRAMNCEIPHFVGAKELSLGQTVDWLRHEGPMRGWTRASLADAHSQAQEGLLVIAIPKDIKLKQLAVMLPDEETTPDGKPYVAAAGKARGNKLKLGEALGVSAAECFVHQ
jgi:hypothetical protein